MKTRSIFINYKDLHLYLEKHWQGFETKHYELFLALLLAKLHSLKFGEKYHIGLPAQQNIDRDLPREYSDENLITALSGYLDENTHIDFFLVPESEICVNDYTGLGKASGIAFQAKRILNKNGETLSETVLNYLNDEISNKYSNVSGALLLFLGGPKSSGELDLDFAKENLNTDRYLFEQILFVGGIKDSICFGELWPNFGRDGFSMKEILDSEV